MSPLMMELCNLSVVTQRRYTTYLLQFAEIVYQENVLRSFKYGMQFRQTPWSLPCVFRHFLVSVLVLKSPWLDSERERERERERELVDCFNCFLITRGCKRTLALPLYVIR